MRRIMPFVLLLVGLSWAAALPAAAAPAPATPSPSPAFTPAVPYPKAGVCVDETATMPVSTCTKIVTVLRADERKTTDEIAVAIVRTTGIDSIEDWATGLFNAWGVGKAGKNNGVLLVIALDDHKLRIATGDGARRRLTDLDAAEIIRGKLTPLLRAGRLEDAVMVGLDDIRRGLGHTVTSANALTTVSRGDIDALAAAQSEDHGGGGSTGALWLGGLLIVAVLGVWAYVGYQKSAHGDEYAGLDDADKPWWARGNRYGRSTYYYNSSSGSSDSGSSGSDSSSGSSGFGGGSSSGGGASGSW
jgi:uncharacterized protein